MVGNRFDFENECLLLKHEKTHFVLYCSLGNRYMLKLFRDYL